MLNYMRQNILVAILVSAISMVAGLLLAGAVIWMLFVPAQYFFLDIFYPDRTGLWLGSVVNDLFWVGAQGFVAGSASYTVARVVCISARVGLATSIVGTCVTLWFLVSAITIISTFGFTTATFAVAIQIVAMWCGLLSAAFQSQDRRTVV